MHISKRGNRWTGSVEIERDPITGKRRRKYASGKTKREVQEKLTEILHSINAGTYTEDSKITFAEYLNNWLQTYCKQNLAPTTYESYKLIIEKHIIPGFEKIKLQKLQPINIQNYITSKLENGRLDGKGALSAKTVSFHYRVMSEALKHAVKLQLIIRNPCDAVDPPKPKKYKSRVYDEKQLMLLFEAFTDTIMEIPVFLGAMLGLRRGEVLGLKWDDIDFESGTITISETVVRVLGTYTKEPKSETSRRTVVVPQTLLNILKKGKRKQAEYKLMLGPAYQDNNLVCCLEDGSPISPSSFSHRFRNILKQSELPKIRFHDLRHSYATLLLKNKVPAKVASTLLGHSNVGITLDLYSHVLSDMQEEAAEKIDRLFDIK